MITNLMNKRKEGVKNKQVRTTVTSCGIEHAAHAFSGSTDLTDL